MKATRVVLTGFMGAGKSTVGPLLAARLGFDFIDADQHLVSTVGLSVDEIFKAHGEPGFRRMEADTVRQLLGLGNVVVALGGGALETAATRELLQKSAGTCVVFLDAPVDTLLGRCEEQPGSAVVRPLFDVLRKDRARLEEKLSARLPHYRTAHLTVATADLTAEEVAERIVRELERLRDAEPGPVVGG